jgi:fructosamine-3-kinase
VADEQRWQVAVAEALGHTPAALRWTPCGGSALNAAWRADAGDRRWFVKVNRADRLPMFDAEAAGLAALAATGAVRVPQSVACGSDGARAYLVLEWLEVDGRGTGAALGHALAALHRSTAARFGWSRDNTIGTTPQTNDWRDDWGEFFVDCRLRPQFERAAAQGHRGAWLVDARRLLAVVPRLLADHRPAASLLHGDLWAGNAGQLATGEPVIFDPAVYYGDREADLAMTELFGGFGRAFYAGYESAWPLPPGYPQRRTLYNLYHVVNHVNLFGGSYLGQAQVMIADLLRAG